MKFDMRVDQAALDRFGVQAKDMMARAATAAMTDAAKLAVQGGRQSIAAGGFGANWQNALRAKVYPSSGASLSPAAEIYSKIPYAGAFEYGQTVSGKPLLWLPLDNVPLGRRGKRMSPAEVARSIGPLHSINRPGRPPLLAAVLRLRGKATLVPLFVGVPSITDPKKFSVLDAVNHVRERLPDLYEKHLASLT